MKKKIVTCARCEYPIDSTQNELRVNGQIVCANQVVCRMSQATDLQPDWNNPATSTADRTHKEHLQTLCDRYEAAYNTFAQNATTANLKREMSAFAKLLAAAK